MHSGVPAWRNWGGSKGRTFSASSGMPPLKKNVRDEENSVTITYEDVLAVLQSMMTRCNTVEAMLRFHPTQAHYGADAGGHGGVPAAVFVAA